MGFFDNLGLEGAVSALSSAFSGGSATPTTSSSGGGGGGGFDFLKDVLPAAATVASQYIGKEGELEIKERERLDNLEIKREELELSKQRLEEQIRQFDQEIAIEKARLGIEQGQLGLRGAELKQSGQKAALQGAIQGGRNQAETILGAGRLQQNALR